MLRALSAAIALVIALAGTARAQAPITDRNYAIELYDGVALGSTSLVGMGGAAAASLVGTAGTTINPAAMATRSTTDTEDWNWDFHFDYLNAKGSKDYDNNGSSRDDNGAQLGTWGIGGRYHDWTLSASFVIQSASVAATDGPDANDLDDKLELATLRIRAVIGKWFPNRDIAVGIGVQGVTFSVENADGIEGDTAEAKANPRELFDIAGAGIIAGITYVPRMRNWRVAAALDTEILGADVTHTCNPDDCAGFILPEKIVAPARSVVGFAYRFAPTEWNQLVGGTFRDERSLTLASDLVVTGSSSNAYGLDAFSQKMLQRSGEDVSVSLRGGAELELFPGRLRTRVGSYWEPGRFEGVSGRLHGTFGIDVRVLEVMFAGYTNRYRGRISLTGDVAERYRNLAVSVGFWH